MTSSHLILLMMSSLFGCQLTSLTCDFLEFDSSLVNVLPPTSDPNFWTQVKIWLRLPAQILIEAVGQGRGEGNFYMFGTELVFDS